MKRLSTLAVGVLMVAGCGAPPVTTQPEAGTAAVQMDEQGSAVTTRYIVQAAQAEPKAIANVTASSSSTQNPRWFDVANLFDGNHHSAWAPAATDQAPTLTLELGQETMVSAMAIKTASSTFDVAVWKDGAWLTVATDVTPARYETLDFIDLPDHVTSKVKLTLKPGQNLKICEIKLFSDKPSPVPSQTPSPAPHVDECFTLTSTGALEFKDAGVAGAAFLTVDATSSAAGDSGSVRLVSGGSPKGTSFTINNLAAADGRFMLEGQATENPELKVIIEGRITNKNGARFEASVESLSEKVGDDEILSLRVDADTSVSASLNGVEGQCEPRVSDCFTLDGDAVEIYTRANLPPTILSIDASTQADHLGSARLVSGGAPAGTEFDVTRFAVADSRFTLEAAAEENPTLKLTITGSIRFTQGQSFEAQIDSVAQFDAVTGTQVSEVKVTQGTRVVGTFTGERGDCD